MGTLLSWHLVTISVLMNDGCDMEPDMRSKSDAYWREHLTPEQYHVTREQGTEVPFTGKYVHEKTDGMYTCVACGSELFSSSAKFDSGTGWPSFSDPVNLEHIELREDRSYGVRRTEVLCKQCGAHLGHVFDDGPKASGKRYCINSCALNLDQKKNISR